MKKFILACAGVASVLTSAPAFAYSANDTMRMQERQPAYQAASHPYYRSRMVNPYAYSYGYAPAYVPVQTVAGPQQDTTCVLGVYCSSHSGRNHAGDVCYDANGVAYGLDKDLRWYQLPGSQPDPMRANDRETRCGFSGTYHASAPAPVPTVVAPAPVAVAPTNVVVATPVPNAVPGKFTYRDGLYLVTVTTYADGTDHIDRIYSPQ